jgi:hypothetical protein
VKHTIELNEKEISEAIRMQIGQMYDHIPRDVIPRVVLGTKAGDFFAECSWEEGEES